MVQDSHGMCRHHVCQFHTIYGFNFTSHQIQDCGAIEGYQGRVFITGSEEDVLCSG